MATTSVPTAAAVNTANESTSTTPNKLSTPSKAAVGTLFEGIRSLHDAIHDLAKKTGITLISLFYRSRAAYNKYERLAKTSDTPNSLGFKFKLTGSDELSTQARFREFSKQFDEMQTTHRQKIQQSFIQVAEWEIDTLHQLCNAEIITSVMKLAQVFHVLNDPQGRFANKEGIVALTALVLRGRIHSFIVTDYDLMSLIEPFANALDDSALTDFTNTPPPLPTANPHLDSPQPTNAHETTPIQAQDCAHEGTDQNNTFRALNESETTMFPIQHNQSITETHDNPVVDPEKPAAHARVSEFLTDGLAALYSLLSPAKDSPAKPPPISDPESTRPIGYCPSPIITYGYAGRRYYPANKFGPALKPLPPFTSPNTLALRAVETARRAGPKPSNMIAPFQTAKTLLATTDPPDSTNITLDETTLSDKSDTETIVQDIMHGITNTNSPNTTPTASVPLQQMILVQPPNTAPAPAPLQQAKTSSNPVTTTIDTPTATLVNAVAINTCPYIEDPTSVTCQ
jgi:hypothetical protein